MSQRTRARRRSRTACPAEWRACHQPTWWRSLVAAALLVSILFPAQADADGFVGETRCGNPTCHGAAVDAQQKPWHWARSQWLNTRVDRHSRAYKTLLTEESKRIAGYMGIEATKSEKCLVCHAPPATRSASSSYQVNEGVTCEHCHGPAEAWLVPHKQTDWKQRRAEYAGNGFNDLNDFSRRAEKCAQCHTEIDHEILAGGHPPLQFEMVAYAQLMKHWDDDDEHPGFTPDPTLWALGQIVGLRQMAQAIAARAAGNNYQSLGQFHGFADANCYQCHHKLVEDATRQAQGHVDMLEIAMGALFPGSKADLTGRWNALMGAVRSNPTAAAQKATELRAWLEPFAARLLQNPVSQASTKAIVRQIVDSGQRLSVYREFAHRRSDGKGADGSRSTAEVVLNIDVPWWYTTGPREQTALAIEALVPPGFGSQVFQQILPERKQLNAAINREDQKPAQFNAALSGIKAKLP